MTTDTYDGSKQHRIGTKDDRQNLDADDGAAPAREMSGGNMRSV